MRYSIEPRERRFVKRYGFMSFARNFSDKYSKYLMDKGIDVSKRFAKTAGKKIFKKTVKATGDLIGNKIADKITSASKNHIMKKYSQMKLIMKYQKKDIFLLKKEKKLLIIKAHII